MITGPHSTPPSSRLRAIYEQLQSRLWAAVLLWAAVPLIIVLALKVFLILEPLLAVIGVAVIARLLLLRWRGGGW